MTATHLRQMRARRYTDWNPNEKCLLIRARNSKRETASTATASSEAASQFEPASLLK
jgi:hypothetical protein